MTQEYAEPAPAENQPAPSRLSRRNITWLVTAVLIVAVVAALNLIHVPYVILRPGPAVNTLGKSDGKEVIAVTGAPTYPTSGSLDFTTVSMAGGPNYPVSVIEYLQAKYLSRNAQVDPQEVWFPKDITGKQVQEQNTAEMTDSQETAEVVALRAAGFTVPETISVAAIQKGAASQGVLKVNDVLVRVNNVPVTDLASVATIMRQVKPGTTVPVVVRRGGKEQPLQVPTGNNNGRAVFGIGIAPDYRLPVTIKVNVGDVGGPSAGMMFTLAIYDKLTPGALTGGKRVAGTGTISEDGSVGPIGGIRQKMVGAKDAGAKFFLAPQSDCGDARGYVPSGLTVISVTTVQQAIAQLKKIAGGQTTGFPSCS
ncbi:PDZ domain-containing protein [Calidifontibacter sp. DB0510]|uniref:endopeptidase La n=1 Tax=Metallococcus carri TaxID=1656884 RepID=A0A967EAP3_9MICO|nr:S16 family serine protease [Metallococcus carri]NHN56475.1 PDZ domain-containing protein [Metallococcus carri]NOP36099.1 PDZ domain-containing protein [Calidifontibacter sp. DB2511S]